MEIQKNEIFPYTRNGIVNRSPDDVVFHIGAKDPELNRVIRRKIWEAFMEYKCTYPETVIEASDPVEFIGDMQNPRIFMSVCMSKKKDAYGYSAQTVIGEPVRLYKCERKTDLGQVCSIDIVAPVKLFFITFDEQYPIELFNAIHWSLLNHIGVIVVMVSVMGIPFEEYDFDLFREMQRRYQNSDERIFEVFVQTTDNPNVTNTMFSDRMIKQYFRVMQLHVPLVASAGDGPDIAILQNNDLRLLHSMVQSIGKD